MDNLEWNAGVAETPILDAHITTRPPQGQRMIARKLTGVKPSPAQDLKFINLSHPDDLNRQHEVRTEIRRHVMKDIGQRRRRPRPEETSWRATRTSSEFARQPAPRLQALLIQPMSAVFLPASQALIMVSSIADVININSRSASFWKKDVDAIRLIGPCIHFLLSMPRPPSDFVYMSDLEDLVAREVVRLTCLLLMSKLKESFAFPPSEQESLYARLSEFFAQHVEVLGEKYIELKVWALVTLALLRYHDGKDVYVQEMKREMLAMNKLTPPEFIEIARDIIWIDVLMSPFSENLAADMNPFVSPEGTY
ncbi:hypothetical protein PENSUB_9115 [Penicillium subrubescens]|uniref:Uncharacterized protein n=1 Tax=Penicillium subrubescens TaxID=1316194 RepID=A0A1Q5TE07_9EURO|nr:hypothetical protein PENSUB_9115 [Penicillium subrubescens]